MFKNTFMMVYEYVDQTTGEVVRRGWTVRQKWFWESIPAMVNEYRREMANLWREHDEGVHYFQLVKLERV